MSNLKKKLLLHIIKYFTFLTKKKEVKQTLESDRYTDVVNANFEFFYFLLQKNENGLYL